MSTVFLFKAKKGEQDFGSPTNFDRFINCLRQNDGKIFRIELEKTTRSMSQNNLYWLYLGIIERETGNLANDLHELFRRTLLKPKFIKVMNKELKIPSSTTELKKEEFGEYLDKIYAETGIPIPDTQAFIDDRDSAPLRFKK